MLVEGALATLVIIAVYLKTKGGMKWLIAGIPAILMIVMTIWALVLNQTRYGASHNLLLQVVNAITLLLAIGIVTEGFIKIIQIKSES